MKKILVIEDIQFMRDEIISLLSSEGFCVKGAKDGLLGLKEAKNFLPDLIICDIVMPGIDGYSLLERLRRDHSTATIPFIFTTVKSDRDEIRKGMDTGADDYLIKPFSKEELLSSVRTQISKQENHNRKIELITREALQYRLSMEEVVTDISNRFIHIPLSEIDREINITLKTIGEFMEADRCYVFFLPENEKKIDCRYEWCAEGISERYQHVKGTSLESFPWTMNKFNSFESVSVSRVSELPEEARPEKERWQSAGIQSILSIPLYLNQKLTGYFGLNMCRTEKKWKNEDTRLLKLTGEIFVQVLERKKAQEALNNWILMEELLTNISTRFISVKSSEVERAINHSLKAIGQFTGTDRVFIYLFSKDRKKIKYIYEWCGEHIAPHKENLKKLSPFSWSIKSLNSFEPVIINSISELPTDAEAEKKYLHSQNIKSILVIPLKLNHILSGYSGFMTEKREKIWQEKDIKLLKMTGEIFAHVLERKKPEEIIESSRVIREGLKFHNIIGKSTEMQKIYSLIEDLADVQSTVIITGETGTGKELVAEALHHNGLRRHKPLVRVNCSALSENLLESELFGHVKGSFTGAVNGQTGRFQMADGGTIFLDEIGDISKNIQMKLLRVLQHMEFEKVGNALPVKVDVRIIAATNQDLMEKVKEGNFREDLYYRLKVVELTLPPLRERKEDIPLLVEHFIDKFNMKFNKKISSLSHDITGMFMNYSWPGNIRELEHIMEHAFVVCNKSIITYEHMPADFQSLPEKRKKRVSDEKQKILEVLEKSKWKKSLAAQMLGISRQYLYKKLRKYKIEG